jgi:hypothetical protein
MEWISVKDEPAPKKCLVFSEKHGIHVAIWEQDIENYIVGGWESCCYCGGRSILTVDDFSHWMALPALPTDEDDFVKKMHNHMRDTLGNDLKRFFGKEKDA